MPEGPGQEPRALRLNRLITTFLTGLVGCGELASIRRAERLAAGKSWIFILTVSCLHQGLLISASGDSSVAVGDNEETMFVSPLASFVFNAAALYSSPA